MPFAALVGAALGGIGGGGAPPTPNVSGPINDNSPINIAPVGFNMGEIGKQWTEGSSVNGGSGLAWPSRYITGSDGRVSFATSQVTSGIPAQNTLASQGNILKILLGLTAAGIGFALFKGFT
jgi:hypothetical protein